ncbi:MAG: GGDEF domain-containing protein [Lachnospiraceae bacterium]|nr:GGDEF domain-containing protein [Lachnospiraceae bacterium]
MIYGKKLVALCAYGISNAQVFSFIMELNEQLKKQDCILFIYTMNTEIGNGGEFYKAEASVYDLIPYEQTDAVIIMDEKIKSREVVQHIIDECHAHGVPPIIIDGDYDDVSVVKFNYAKGFEPVVRHIIEDHQVKKPHFMAGKRHSEYSNERIEIFKKVIAENGIPFSENMISYGDFWSLPCRAATEKLLERDELPDAIICANDIMAINVCDVLQLAGISVPGEVLVSGFDGIDEAFLSTPGITTAICDSHSLAKAVKAAVKDVLAKGANVEKWVVPSFVANESCGCPRVDLASLSKIHDMNNRFYHHQDDLHIMHNLTAVMMCSKHFNEIAKHIQTSISTKMCCVVDSGLFDVKHNYFLTDSVSVGRTVICDYLNPNAGVQRYSEETMTPYIQQVIDKGFPLIFNALEYMGKSIGYVMYLTEGYDLIEWSRYPNIANCLGMGLGGFTTLRYQDYLREKIRRLYQKDALTGIYNRLAFINRFEELKENPEYVGQQVTVLMTDLNGLKQINDSYGHSAGDQAIATVAKALTKNCPQDAICVRFGGDEMLALFFGSCDKQDFVDRMQKTLALDSMKYVFSISASYGFCSTTLTEDLDLDKLIAGADEEMYRMKKNR